VYDRRFLVFTRISHNFYRFVRRAVSCVNTVCFRSSVMFMSLANGKLETVRVFRFVYRYIPYGNITPLEMNVHNTMIVISCFIVYFVLDFRCKPVDRLYRFLCFLRFHEKWRECWYYDTRINGMKKTRGTRSLYELPAEKFAANFEFLTRFIIRRGGFHNFCIKTFVDS